MSTTVVRTTTEKLEAVIAEQEEQSRHLTSAQFTGGRDWVLFFQQLLLTSTIGATGDTDCPDAGDTVLFRMPDDWMPELGVRVYPAIVLYQTNRGARALDLQVFTGVYGQPYYGWVYEGADPGQWHLR